MTIIRKTKCKAAPTVFVSIVDIVVFVSIVDIVF